MCGCGAVGAAYIIHVKVIAESETLVVSRLSGWRFVKVNVTLADLVRAFTRKQHHRVSLFPSFRHYN